MDKFAVSPQKFAVKFRYEKPIKGIIQTEHEFRIVEAFDIIDAVLIVKNDGNYREVSDPVVYCVYEVNEEV
jgi:hypothetical protein